MCDLFFYLCQYDQLWYFIKVLNYLFIISMILNKYLCTLFISLYIIYIDARYFYCDAGDFRMNQCGLLKDVALETNFA